jgi:hypothetical protein
MSLELDMSCCLRPGGRSKCYASFARFGCFCYPSLVLVLSVPEQTVEERNRGDVQDGA